MNVGIPRETCPGEARVALTPAAVKPLAKAGISVLVERGAGDASGASDAAFEKEGARIVSDRSALFAASDAICQVRTVGANPRDGRADLELMRPGQAVVGLCDPLSAGEPLRDLAGRGVLAFALELMPRITRAQAMDVLSSQATIAGYKAVLLAAVELPRVLPMMITAAGTLAAAKVFVIGAGVAGLQAISTAKRNGAVVTAYDVRAAVKEQVESVGGRFLHIEIAAGQSEDKGGYARAMDEEFYRRQRELMGGAVAHSDVVITTAAVPGKRAPVLVTAEMVERMHPGSIIVDLAAERGGNCELSRADERVVTHGVTILGPTNLPATVPAHASQMFTRNLQAFLLHIVKDGKIDPARDDEIIQGTLVAREGQVVHPRVRETLGLPALQGSAP